MRYPSLLPDLHGALTDHVDVEEGVEVDVVVVVQVADQMVARTVRSVQKSVSNNRQRSTTLATLSLSTGRASLISIHGRPFTQYRSDSRNNVKTARPRPPSLHMLLLFQINFMGNCSVSKKEELRVCPECLTSRLVEIKTIMHTNIDAIDFLVSTFFEKGEEWIVLEKFLEMTVFEHFIGATDTQTDVAKILKAAVTNHHGSSEWEYRGKYHQLHFRLRCRVDVTEGRWIGPWSSRVFTDIKDVKLYPSGSKIAFKRLSSLDSKMPAVYLHTGVLVRIGGEEYVIEVQKDDERRVSTVMKKWDNLDHTNIGEVYVDNTYLKTGNIRVKDLLYRLSRIIGIAIQYDPT